MQKITPFLWFEKNMKEIVDFYSSVFPGTQLKGGGELENTPSGAVQMATITIFDTDFSLMTAGPYLPFNPTVSFIISCASPEEVSELWHKIAVGGKTLMELGTYPFTEKYGWTQDRYGVSWQIMYSTGLKSAQKITPTLMFVGAVCGRAEEAVNFYTSVFHHSKIEHVLKYDGTEPMNDEKAKVKHAQISIENFDIALMDAGGERPFSFEQAISFVVSCETQAEIDYYWDKLKEGGKEIQCGWLNDKFGFPWQIVPTAMERMMSTGSKEQIARVTQAFMKMKKFDIATLEVAFKS